MHTTTQRDLILKPVISEFLKMTAIQLLVQASSTGKQQCLYYFDQVTAVTLLQAFTQILELV
jgi:hypothetical protein